MDAYYLTDSDSGRLFSVQGSSITLDTTTTSYLESALAVTSVIRTYNIFLSDTGSEYNLNGTPTGATYLHTVPGAYFSDGTTDGTFNYALDNYNGTVYRFNLDWSSPAVLFSLGNGSGSRLGITYDPTNNSLWLSGYNTNVIEDWSLAGVLLSSFTIGHASITALAFDSGDSTLWLGYEYNRGTYEQFTHGYASLH